VVDDEPGLRKARSLLLTEEGYDVEAEGDPAKALEWGLERNYELILCDVRMPGLTGLEYLREYRRRGGNALMIMMSAYGGEDAAIEAMKEGAYDYLPKPFRAEEVLLTLRKAEERELLRSRVASLEAELAKQSQEDVVADSPAMRDIMELIARVALHTSTVLLTGESGVGKEVMARVIHKMSPRRDRPFFAVNCGAIPEQLLESELFGHVRGAFTGAETNTAGLFAEADGSTLLLDEVGELPLALQVKLLRVLQEGEMRRVGDTQTTKVDVRIVAATSRDLGRDVAEGRFREDLFFRLNVIPIAIPPLRDRTEDLEALIGLFVRRLRGKIGRAITVTPEAMRVLLAYEWPGNIRELANVLERAAVVSPDGVVSPELLVGLDTSRVRGPLDQKPRTLGEAVFEAERIALEQALRAAGSNRKRAAETLGISVRTLFYKLKQHGL
jgi:two-component system response regulator AtoC